MTGNGASLRIEDTTVNGPYGTVPVRLYIPEVRSDVGLVWAHGGAFIGGDLDAAESHWVASRLADGGVTVIAVDYQLAPVPEELVDVLGHRVGVHYPVPSTELTAVFRWAASPEGPGQSLRWMLGGASAGAALAAGAALQLRDDSADRPAGLVLAYPLLHYVIPTASPDLAAALKQLPPGERFLPADVAAMNDNYLGPTPENQAPYAFAGGKDLIGLPPTVIVASQLDGLRPSAEAFSDELGRDGVPVTIVVEPGTRHGHLSTPEDHPGAQRTIDRFLAAMGLSPTA